MNNYTDSCIDIVENKLVNWGLTLKFKVIEKNNILRYSPVIMGLDGSSDKFVDKDGILFKVDCRVKNNDLFFTVSEISNYKLKGFDNFTKYLNQLGIIKDTIDVCNELAVPLPIYVGVGSISDMVCVSEIYNIERA